MNENKNSSLSINDTGGTPGTRQWLNDYNKTRNDSLIKISVDTSSSDPGKYSSTDGIYKTGDYIIESLVDPSDPTAVKFGNTKIMVSADDNVPSLAATDTNFVNIITSQYIYFTDGTNYYTYYRHCSNDLDEGDDDPEKGCKMGDKYYAFVLDQRDDIDVNWNATHDGVDVGSSAICNTHKILYINSFKPNQTIYYKDSGGAMVSLGCTTITIWIDPEAV